jgi:hypothetical protein
VKYETLFDYIHCHRQELLKAYEEQSKRAEIIGKTLGHIHPAERSMPLQAFANEQIIQAEEIRRNVTTRDSQVEEEHLRIQNAFTRLMLFGSAKELYNLVKLKQ